MILEESLPETLIHAIQSHRECTLPDTVFKKHSTRKTTSPQNRFSSSAIPSLKAPSDEISSENESCVEDVQSPCARNVKNGQSALLRFHSDCCGHLKSAFKFHLCMKSKKREFYGDRKRPVEIACSTIDKGKSATVVNVKMKSLLFQPQIIKTVLSKLIILPQLVHLSYKTALVTLWQKSKIVKGFQSAFIIITILKRGCKTQEG